MVKTLNGAIASVSQDTERIQTEFPILVCDLSTDAIIGTDTLGSVLPHTLDIKNGSLFTEGGVSLQLHRMDAALSGRVFTVGHCLIPPYSEAVLHCTTRTVGGRSMPSSGLLEGLTVFAENTGLVVGRTLVDPSGWTIPVLVSNFGQETVMVEPFSEIGSAQVARWYLLVHVWVGRTESRLGGIAGNLHKQIWRQRARPVQPSWWQIGCGATKHRWRTPTRDVPVSHMQSYGLVVVRRGGFSGLGQGSYWLYHTLCWYDPSRIVSGQWWYQGSHIYPYVGFPVRSWCRHG